MYFCVLCCDKCQSTSANKKSSDNEQYEEVQLIVEIFAERCIYRTLTTNWVQQIRQKLSNAVLGFRTAIVDGTRKERDCRSSLLEQDSISLFYCNSRKAILNPHQPQAKQSFAESFLHALLFLEKAGSTA